MTDPFGNDDSPGIGEDSGDFEHDDHYGDEQNSFGDDDDDIHDEEQEDLYEEHEDERDDGIMGMPPAMPAMEPQDDFGSSQNFMPPSNTSFALPEESDALSNFNREWERKIADKQKEQEQIAAKARNKAKQELANFQKEREIRKEGKQTSNRSEEQNTLERLERDIQNDNPWERILTLVEVDQKEKDEGKPDVSRMKSIFIQLKNEPLKASG